VKLFVLIILTLTGSISYANPSINYQVNELNINDVSCSYIKDGISESNYLTLSNMTRLEYTYNRSTVTLYQNLDFDMIRYISGFLSKHEDRSLAGDFYGVRRDDTDVITFKVVEGFFVDNIITDAVNLVWDFGKVDERPQEAIVHTMGGLTCIRSN